MKAEKIFKDLPEGIREKAIANHKEDYPEEKEVFRDLREAVLTGFVWHDTPEGFDYWNEVYNSLLDTK